uniref:Restriction enzyme n=1 Tax=Siphoviridae sp. ctxMM9 TaxID=2827973 RepID=A0A8S5T649_9CAUD|nr:MAG TPA: restriction enzyme [Siphoviridae sp. ctxMM9]
MPKKKTQEEFERDVYNKLGENYELLSPYTNAHGKVLMRHLICGNKFEKNIHDIITKGSGCPYCNGTKPAKYNE